MQRGGGGRHSEAILILLMLLLVLIFFLILSSWKSYSSGRNGARGISNTLTRARIRGGASSCHSLALPRIPMRGDPRDGRLRDFLYYLG